MAKFHTPKLAPNGRYRVNIGKRFFWLGKDHQQAVRLTKALEVAWENEQSKGADEKKCWSDQSIRSAFQMVGVPSPVKAEVSANEQSKPQGLAPAAKPQLKFKPAFLPNTSTITLHQAIDRYCKMRVADMTKRTAGKDSAKILKSVKLHIPDMPLHSIGAPEQKTLTDILKARPQRKNGKPIKMTTVTKWLMQLGSAFAWFSHPDSGIGWVVPYADWREKFSIDDFAAKAIAKNTNDYDYEKDKVKPTFTEQELVPIYNEATDRGKLYLLGGVLLGWTAVEFSTLERQHVQDDPNTGDTYIVNKERSKTGVVMSYWVAPPLAKLLKKAIAETPKDPKINPQGLALMTKNRQGNPAALVHLVGDGMYHKDTVGELWDETVKRVNRAKVKVPSYPHSRLRKLGGQLIKNVADHAIAQTFLAHKKGDVASTNYVRIDLKTCVGVTELQRVFDAQKQAFAGLEQILFKAAEKKQAPKELIAA